MSLFFAPRPGNKFVGVHGCYYLKPSEMKVSSVTNITLCTIWIAELDILKDKIH